MLDDALTFAATQGRDGKGVAIFWAVDNAPNPVANDEVCSHPATVAVGRSTRSDRENGSAFGPELDLLAPGVDVFSTQSGGDYGTSTGTSFAAPCTAGVAALVVAAKPEATADEVRRILRDTCDQIGGVTYTDGRHAKYGFGRINAEAAVLAALAAAGTVVAGAGTPGPDLHRIEIRAQNGRGAPLLPRRDGSGSRLPPGGAPASRRVGRRGVRDHAPGRPASRREERSGGDRRRRRERDRDRPGPAGRGRPPEPLRRAGRRRSGLGIKE